MLGSDILEIAIGLVFIYLVLSLIATSINEGASAVFRFRGRLLSRTIIAMLLYTPQRWQRKKKLQAGEEVAQESVTDLESRFFDHPLIKNISFGKQGRSLPSYLASDRFADVMLRVLDITKDDTTVEALEKKLNQLPKESEVRKVLVEYVKTARTEVIDFKSLVEEWFDDTMNMASEWYKKRIQMLLFFVGLILAIAFNADTFHIVEILSDDPDARAALVEQATTFIEEKEDSYRAYHPTDSSYIGSLLKQDVAMDEQSAAILNAIDSTNQVRTLLLEEELAIAKSSLGMGWGDAPVDVTTPKAFFRALGKGSFWQYIAHRFLGWIITAFAVSLGAPFWFDLLKRIINIRGAMKKPEMAAAKGKA